MNLNQNFFSTHLLKYNQEVYAELSLKFPELSKYVLSLEEKLGYSFSNKTIAAVSLTHRSALVYWHSGSRIVFSNEVLEFYGDSVLNFIVSTILMEKFSNFSEGDLSKMRSLIVGTENLANKAEQLMLNTIVLTGKSEQLKTPQVRKTNILADCFEAVLGAYAIEAGLGRASEWVQNLFQDDFSSVSLKFKDSDPKSKLQQMTQKILNVHPLYKIIGSESTHTENLFIVGVFLNGKELARAKAANKREASKIAAKIVLDMIENKMILEEEILSLRK
jgi:ribonuclease III